MDEIRFDEKGLVPVITQEARTKDVLMVAYMNREALELTVSTKKMHYYSRSRSKLWLKGETSGHFQTLLSLRADCDNDTLLAEVEQEGVACHTGSKSCFFKKVYGEEEAEKPFGSILEELYETVLDRKANPVEGSYTNWLLDEGIDKILKKVGEESAEVIIAAKNSSKQEISYEVADLLYHLSVMLAHQGVSWEEALKKLKGRRNKKKSEY
ncbi:MAG: bifunctional phosphoribosyl-AMP cyclohydrolase/phosphoribosyl-ATP diphosphatase HisIE [Clostridiales bacterium]|jgi:phosphoribosyl-ATP pyrophosphohydrolase/phosphoribosyl-AMP cyclohydrolase|nr:bifunctional phosphoribosyl-AMP cyclohydrolase/phosphoribosyl-ATP diphosphatase HisIE [Clostridiales bacterium]